MMKKILSLGPVFFCLCGLLFPQGFRDRAILSVEKNPETIRKLRKKPLDLLKEGENRIYIHASFEDAAWLEEKGIPYEIEEEGASLFACSSSQAMLHGQGGVNGAFHSYSEVEKELLDIAQTYPDIAQLFDIGDSLEGRNLYALKISGNVQIEEDEAVVVFLGCHHAREWISVEVPLFLGKHLVEYYQQDPRIRSLVNQSEIWIVPLVNPDGLEYSIHFYRYWRKNRRDNGNGYYGVDLNRNYGYKWGIDNNGSSPFPYSDVYRGTSAFSEPETKAIRDFFGQKLPEALVSYHSYSQVILFPWGYAALPSDKDALLTELAEDMSSLMESVNGRAYGYGSAAATLYLTNGDTTDWSFGIWSIPSFTVELPPVDEAQGGFFNPEEDISSIFDENLPAALYLIEWAVQNYRPGSGAKKWGRQAKGQDFPRN